MEKNELRIGNWINPSFPVQVDQDNIEFYAVCPDMASGIPISADWILKLDLSVRSESEQKRTILRSVLSRGFVDAEGVSYYFTICEHKIKFIHQLQNLFFALTGKELE